MSDILIQLLWSISSIAIFLCGIYFCFRFKFIHLNFIKIIKAMKHKSNEEDGISLFQSLTISLAGRIGVGSLSGIALAVYLGGPGILFWIWATSFLCAINSFVESILATIFRKKDYGHIYRGGPFYYISEGLKNKKIAILYAIIVLITFIGGFLTMQVNAIAKCVNDLYSINPLIIGIIIAFLTAIIIIGGIKKIALTTSKLVPFMIILYLVITIYIILVNINMIPNIILDIFNSAFNFKAFGFGIVSTLLLGMQKGIFSSEVGLGTGSIAAAIADTDMPVNNGLVQAFGVHIENLVFATITTFIICMSSYKGLNINDPNGIEITLFAFREHIGILGSVFILITIFLFGFSSIITAYYYGESSLKFIKNTKKQDIILLKVISLFSIIISSIMPSKILWKIIDILIGIIAIVNTYAIYKLRKIVIDEYEYYKFKNRKKFSNKV